jgi:glycosyltransferase involved in cell wall biosynthesis
VSIGDARALRRHIDRFKPDVVHVHNVTPLLSPWVVRTAHAAGVPVVQTVQNYLHECIAATYFRDGHPCHDCRGRTVPWPAVLHGCNLTAQVNGPVSGRMTAAVLGASLVLHRSTWRLVDRFVAVGEAIAHHLATAGFDPARITVRGNPVDDPGTPSLPGTDALFVGRLAESKGARLLVEAWKRSGLGDRHRLRFAGGGPEHEAIERAGAGVPGIEFLGVVDHQRALALMNEAAFVVAPALWEEPFGLVVVEAMARGRPVLVTALGEPAQIVDDQSGWVVEPNVDALADGLRAAFAGSLGTMGAAARRRYEERYSPPVALRKLLTIYTEILAVSGAR